MSNLTRKLRRLRGADQDKFFKTMPMGRQRRSGRKGQPDARVFDAVDFFAMNTWGSLPEPPHRLGLQLVYHTTKGFRWWREA